MQFRALAVTAFLLAAGAAFSQTSPTTQNTSPTTEPAPASIREPRLKFMTLGAGVYRVAYEEIAGHVRKMGDPRRWSLWCVGRPVPMLVKGGEDGRFEAGDYLEWYAAPLQTPHNRITLGSFDSEARVTTRDAYTEEGAYFLHFLPGATPPPRLRDVATTVPLRKSFWPNRTFRRTRRFEDNVTRRNFKPDANAEHTDGIFWDHFSWPSRPLRHPYRHLIGLDPNATDACSLTLKLWGANQPIDPPEHQARLTINTHRIADLRWPGARPFYYTTTTLAPKIFKEWATEFTIEAEPRASKDHPDMMLLDWIEVAYTSFYRAENDALEFVGPPMLEEIKSPYRGWLNPLTLEAFRHTPIWVLDRTSGERQELPIGKHWKIQGTDLYNVYLPIARPGHAYVAYTPTSLRKPTSVGWVPADRLRSKPSGAEYLVITHEKFAAEARRLADHRTTLGLRATVVTTDEIANSYNEGFSNILAIRHFIRQAYQTWTPRPRFVLLVGDASWDDRGTSGSEYANYVPTYYHTSPYMGAYASDNWFACMDDADAYPDVAIGRLPVRSVEEARAYVDKLIEYDTKPAAGDWRQSAFLLASSIRYSHQELDRLASTTLAALSPVRLYTTSSMRADGGLPTTATQLFDRGHALVIFAGHGGSFVWQVGGNTGGAEAPALFSPDHVKRLTNKGKYPLVCALTCYTNSFDNPMRQTIGESLILEPDRGAIAVVSATWRGTLENEFPLTRSLVGLLAANPDLTLGEAFSQAKRELPIQENLHGLCILGDPALRIYFDARPNNVPPAGM